MPPNVAVATKGRRPVEDFDAYTPELDDIATDEVEDDLDALMHSDQEVKLATLVVSNITSTEMSALRSEWSLSFKLTVQGKGVDFYWVYGGTVEEMVKLKHLWERYDKLKGKFEVHWITMRLANGAPSRLDKTRQVTGFLEGHLDRFDYLCKEVEKTGARIVDRYVSPASSRRGFFNLLLARRDMIPMALSQAYAIAGNVINLSTPQSVIPVRHPLEVIVEADTAAVWKEIKRYIESNTGQRPVSARRSEYDDPKIIFRLKDYECTAAMVREWNHGSIVAPMFLVDWNTRENTWKDKSKREDPDAVSRLNRLEDRLASAELKMEVREKNAVEFATSVLQKLEATQQQAHNLVGITNMLMLRSERADLMDYIRSPEFAFLPAAEQSEKRSELKCIVDEIAAHRASLRTQPVLQPAQTPQPKEKPSRIAPVVEESESQNAQVQMQDDRMIIDGESDAEEELAAGSISRDAPQRRHVSEAPSAAIEIAETQVDEDLSLHPGLVPGAADKREYGSRVTSIGSITDGACPPSPQKRHKPRVSNSPRVKVPQQTLSKVTNHRRVPDNTLVPGWHKYAHADSKELFYAHETSGETFWVRDRNKHPEIFKKVRPQYSVLIPSSQTLGNVRRVEDCGSCRSSFMLQLNSVLRFVLFLLLFNRVIAVDPANVHDAAGTFSIVSQNLGGCMSVEKMNEFRDAIAKEMPDIFLIPESKQEDMFNRFQWADYLTYTTQGVTMVAVNGWQAARRKWGIAMGVRRGVAIIETDQNIEGLMGRVIRVRILSKEGGFDRQWDIIGIYAPAQVRDNQAGTSNDDQSDDELEQFWDNLANYIKGLNNAGRTIVVGDYNATLNSRERAGGLRGVRMAHTEMVRRFLNKTLLTDVWSQQESKVEDSWTCTRYMRNGTTRDEPMSIIDRACVGGNAVRGSCLSTLSHFVSRTNHRMIKLVVKGGGRIHTRVDDPFRLADSTTRRRIMDERRVTDEQKSWFREVVEGEVQALRLRPDSYPEHLVTEEDFDKRYKALTECIVRTSAECFGRRKQKVRGIHVENRETKAAKQVMLAWNRVLRAIKEDRLDSTIQKHRWLGMYVDEAKELVRSSSAKEPAVEMSFDEAAKTLRAKAGKDWYRTRCKADREHMDKREAMLVKHALQTGSIKRLVRSADTVTNMLAFKNPEGQLVWGKSEVLEEHRRYVSKLYTKPQEQSLSRSMTPWLDSDKSREFRRKADSDPFQWPRPVSMESFNALLRRGNRRPTPGPDGWEKWVIRLLPEDVKQDLISMLNYVIGNSYFPANLKAAYLQMLYKKKDPLLMDNYRCIMYSNWLSNAVGSWYALSLQDYAEKHGLLPDNQIATRPGVEMGDLTSVLSHVERYVSRRSEPRGQRDRLYVLQKDVAKGFDSQLPSGFYMACEYFGLGQKVVDFDRARQKDIRVSIITAYGLTKEVTITDVQRQGDPPSPIKFALTAGMGNHWIVERLFKKNGRIPGIHCTSLMHDKGPTFRHTPADELDFHVTDASMMDDTVFLARSLAELQEMNEEDERFKVTVGSATSWAKSNIYCSIRVGKSAEKVKLVSVTRDLESEVELEVKDLSEMCMVGATGVRKSKDHAQKLVRKIGEFRIPTLQKQISPKMLARVFKVSLMSQISAKLFVQPVLRSEAVKIQRAVDRRACEILGFARCLDKFEKLLTPEIFGGYGWPSVVRLNDMIAIRRFHRDCTSKIPALRGLSQILLSDLSCGRGKCGEMSLDNKILPVSWTVANQAMKLWRGGLRWQLHNDPAVCSVGHLLQMSGCQKGGVADSLLALRDISTRCAFEEWPQRIHELVFSHAPSTITRYGAGLRQCWNRWTVQEVVRTLKLWQQWTVSAQKRRFERRLGIYVGKPAIEADGSLVVASDGSWLRAEDGCGNSVSGAIATSTMSKAVAIAGESWNSSHGEYLGLMMALVAAQRSGCSSVKIYTDYLSNIRLCEQASDSASEAWIRTALQRWVRELVSQTRSAGISVEIEHVKAHTGQQDHVSLLNEKADQAAKDVHHTLSYDSFTVFDGLQILTGDNFDIAEKGIFKWLRRNPRTDEPESYTRHLFEPQTSELKKPNLAFSSRQRMLARLEHTQTRLREHRYKQAMLCLFVPPYCDCGQIESQHHLFAQCDSFDKFKAESIAKLKQIALKRDFDCLSDDWLDGFFADSEIWPTRLSQWYLNKVPKLPENVPREKRVAITRQLEVESELLLGRIIGSRVARMKAERWIW